MKVIINADDFGFSKSINKGIIDAYNEGLISSTTIMANMPYIDDAINRYKENTNLGLGIHLNLTVGSPLSDNVTSLVNEKNNFYYIDKIQEKDLSYEDVYRELKMQIEKVLSYNVKLDHLDYHHSLVAIPVIKRVYFDLSKEYDLPIRCTTKEVRDEAQKENILTADLFCHDFSPKENPNYQTIIDFINSNQEANAIEIMTHIGYIDDETKKRTSYINRDNEINELRKLKETGFYKTIELISYKDL